MFRYIYWPDSLAAEIGRELYRCQFHFQAVLPVADFTQLEPGLFRLQSRGIPIELLLLAEDRVRDIQLSNALLRLVSGGARIAWAIPPVNPQPYYLMDKQTMWSGMNLQQDQLAHPMVTILDRYRAFDTHFAAAEPIQQFQNALDIRFWTRHDWVLEGEGVDLYWEVRNAELIYLEHEAADLPARGHWRVEAREDRLYRLVARNSRHEASKTIFIKVMPPQPVALDVCLWEDELQAWLPLTSPPGFPGYYAGLIGQQLSLTWDAGVVGRLEEATWGTLPLRGQRIVRLDADQSLLFRLHTLWGVTEMPLHLVVVHENTGEDAWAESDFQALMQQFDRDKSGPANFSIPYLWAVILHFFGKRKPLGEG